MKTILVPLRGVGGDAAPLEMAGRIARMFDAHMDGLHVQRSTISEVASLTMGVGMQTQDIWDTIDAEINRQAQSAKTAFFNFHGKQEFQITDKPQRETGCTGSWHSFVGDFKAEIIAQGRVHDLIVIGRDVRPFGFTSSDFGHILLQTGRPVLVAPARLPATTCQTLAIAWKETAESAHALTAAMPLIQRAKRLVVIAAGEGDDIEVETNAARRLAAQLKWHACEADVHVADCEDRSVTEALLSAANTVGADLLVMGGYGHSRALEFVLGGVTRDLLDACAMPLLITH